MQLKFEADDLTDRERDVLAFIIDFRKKKKKSPLLVEIAKHMGVVSRGNAHDIVSRIIEKGYLEKNEHFSRCIILSDKTKNLMTN